LTKTCMWFELKTRCITYALPTYLCKVKRRNNIDQSYVYVDNFWEKCRCLILILRRLTKTCMWFELKTRCLEKSGVSILLKACPTGFFHGKTASPKFQFSSPGRRTWGIVGSLPVMPSLLPQCSLREKSSLPIFCKCGELWSDTWYMVIDQI
jgi:hypothetical protein